MNPAALVVGLTTLISWGLMDQSRKSGWMLVPYRVRHHGEVHRVLSHAFVHADWMHLLFNMYVLYEFGQTVAVELAGTALGGFGGFTWLGSLEGPFHRFDAMETTLGMRVLGLQERPARC